MTSIYQSLGWEFIRRGRWAIPGTVLLASLLPISIYSILSGIAELNYQDRSLSMIHLVFFQLVGFMMAFGIGAALGSIKRLFTLPISTSSIVAWHTLIGCVVLAGQMVLFSWFMNMVFDARWPLWGPALFAAAMWALMQPVIFQPSLASLAWMFISLVASQIWLKARYGNWSIAKTNLWTTVTPVEIATLLATIAIGFFVALAAAKRQRCGEPDPTLGIWSWSESKWNEFQERIHRDSPPFQSAAHAQAWFQWQHKGWAFSAEVAGILLFGGLGATIHYWNDHRGVVPEVLEGLFGLGLLLSAAAIGAGCLLAVNMNQTGQSQKVVELAGHAFRLGDFQATRPLTNVQQAVAILKTAIKSTLIGWATWAAVVLVFVGIAWQTDQWPAKLTRELSILHLLLYSLLAMWICMTAVAVLALTGRPKVIFAVALLVPTTIVALLIGSNRRWQRDWPSPAMLGWEILAFLIITGTAIVFTLEWRRGEMPKRWLVASIGLAIAILTLSIATVPLANFAWAYPLLVAFAALIVMPIAAAPQAISWSRHR
jgi:HAMP domain-containing protein